MPPSTPSGRIWQVPPAGGTFVRRRPAAQAWWPRSYWVRVALGMLLFASIWLGELAASSLTAPMDNIEQLTWVRSLQWGYYKHPPLPTWLLWPVVRLLGIEPLGTYLLGASVTMLALAVYTWMLVQMRGRGHATVALLAALCITFYNGRLHYYNHNTVLMLFVSISALACWQALRRRSLAWWAVLGLAVGLGALSKYQIAVTVVCVAVAWLRLRCWRDAVHRRGLCLASALALLTLLPHLIWLVQSQFLPVHYAMSSSLGVALPWARRWVGAAHWLSDLLLNRLMPAWLLLGLALAGQASRLQGDRGPASDTTQAAAGDELSRLVLLSFGLVPLVFMSALALLFGVELQLQWGTAFAPFVVPAAMELLGVQMMDPARAVRRATRAFLGIQLLLLGLNWFTSARAPERLQSAHWCRFPSAELAQRLAGPARRAIGGPIRIIDGPGTLAGAVAIQLPERPLVLIDGNPSISPWVSPQDLAAGPVLQLRQFEGVVGPTWTGLGADFPGLAWRVHRAGAPD